MMRIQYLMLFFALYSSAIGGNNSVTNKPDLLFPWSLPVITDGKGTLDNPINLSGASTYAGVEYGAYLWLSANLSDKQFRKIKSVSYDTLGSQTQTNMLVKFSYKFVDSGNTYTNYLYIRLSNKLHCSKRYRCRFVSDKGGIVHEIDSEKPVPDAFDFLGTQAGVYSVQSESFEAFSLTLPLGGMLQREQTLMGEISITSVSNGYWLGRSDSWIVNTTYNSFDQGVRKMRIRNNNGGMRIHPF